MRNRLVVTLAALLLASANLAQAQTAPTKPAPPDVPMQGLADVGFRFGSDDGGSLKIPGITFLNRTNTSGTMAGNELRFEGTRGHAWTFGTFTLTEPLKTPSPVVQAMPGVMAVMRRSGMRTVVTGAAAQVPVVQS